MAKLKQKTMTKEFSVRLASAMQEIGSSHCFFIMQQAFGEIDYSECESLYEMVLSENKTDLKKFKDKIRWIERAPFTIKIDRKNGVTQKDILQ